MEHLLYPLIRKYAMTLGELRRDPASNQLRDDLAHLEAVIRMFDPAWDSAAVKPIRPKAAIRWGKRGLASRAAMDVLRTATEPLTVREIAERVMDIHGLPLDNESAVHSVATIVRDALKRRTPFVRCIGASRPKRWELLR